MHTQRSSALMFFSIVSVIAVYTYFADKDEAAKKANQPQLEVVSGAESSSQNTPAFGEKIQIETDLHSIQINLNGGDIVIFLDASISIGSASSDIAGFQILGSAEHNVYFILNDNSPVFKITGPDDSLWAGLFDSRCFTTTQPTDIHNLDQTQVPRFYILSTYSNGTQLQLCGNHHWVCTAMIGLFPSSQGGSDGGRISVYQGEDDNIIYGRIAAGGFYVGAGNGFNIPYCPTVPGDITYREEAYRSNTDFSVVNEECGYFTA